MPEDDKILALRCIERVDECGLIAEQPVGILRPQIEEAGETALIGRQPECLAVGGPIVLALLDQRVPDAHRRLEQAVLDKVKKLPASKLEPSLDLVKTVICPFAQRHGRARPPTASLFEVEPLKCSRDVLPRSGQADQVASAR
jgi:hypothetical protein